MNARIKLRLWAVNICRFVLSGALLSSGFVKLVDPMGMVYKLQAYFTYWSVDIDELWLKLLAVLIGVIELQFGVYMFLGAKRRFSTWGTLLLMLAFLLLSIYLYVDGGVADCGCFGAALELSPKATLLKNVLLTLMATYVVFFPFRIRRLVTERNQGLATIYVFTYGCVLSLYSLHYVPFITFTDYKVGENWATQYHIGAEPARDEILNLAFYDSDGQDVTADVLNDSSTAFYLTLPNVLTADDSSADRINDLYDYAVDNNIEFVALVGDINNYGDWRDRTGASYKALSVDPDVLKAMVRSTPGMLLLHKGVLLGKWGTNNLPSSEDVDGLLSQSSAGVEVDSGEVMVWVRLILLLIVPVLFIISLDGVWVGQKFRVHRKRMKKLLMDHNTKE